MDVKCSRTYVSIPGFEFAEHSYLGDALTLAWDDGQSYVAKNKPFTLPNGLQLTYGQINGLAGDFYATINPISDGKDLQDQRNRFLRAWYWLAEDKTRNPSEAQKILNVLSTEVKMVQNAIDKGIDPSTVYPNIPDVTIPLQLLTVDRPAECPSYLILAKNNWDHFGADARVAYNACHSYALQIAAGGNLQLAYAMNAFGDHFLQDSFSAGHMRTPRRKLHDTAGAADICAKVSPKKCSLPQPSVRFRCADDVEFSSCMMKTMRLVSMSRVLQAERGPPSATNDSSIRRTLLTRTKHGMLFEPQSMKSIRLGRQRLFHLTPPMAHGNGRRSWMRFSSIR
jgi:hypothetical protein